MGLSPRQAAELHELLWQLRAETASPEQLSRLERLVCEDPQARAFYVRYMHLCADLNWNGSVGAEGRETKDAGRGMAGSPAIDGEEGFGVRGSGFGIRDSEPLSVGTEVQLPSGQWPRTPNPEPPIPPIVLDLSSTGHYPLPTSHFSVGSWAFSYMVATVIMGVMLLGFWAIKITHHQHIAEAPSVPSEVRPEMVFVGRITGMVDVKWSDDKDFLPPLGYAYVPLGRKYILDSGLMQITYDSGAKVILQGPCTYEVESTSGGYLALGKLTAKVESGEWRVESGGSPANQKSEIRNQKSSPLSTTHYPLFSVRTPTAVVTDLGTEFGVEVDERGRTKAQVFVGSVRLASIDPSGKATVLSAGQSGIAQSGNVVIISDDADGSNTFVRAMPSPKNEVRDNNAYAKLVLSLGPVAYYRMERPTEEKDLLTVFDSASGGRHGKLSGVGRASGLERLWCEGRFGGGLRFRGEFFGDYVVAPRTPDCDSNQYSFAAWVFADGRGEWWPHLAMDGGSHGHSRLKIALGEYEGYLYAKVAPARGERGLVREHPPNLLPTGQWQHVAVVADGSTIHLYRNGVEKAANRCDGVIASPPGKYLLLGCNNMAKDPTGLVPASFWDGRIDEVAIFHRALRLKEIRQLYEGPAKLQDRGDNAVSALVPIDEKDRFPALASTDGGNDDAHGDWTMFGDPRLDLMLVEADEPKDKGE